MSIQCPNCGYLIPDEAMDPMDEDAPVSEAVPYEAMQGPVTALDPSGQQVQTNASALDVANRPGWEVLAQGDQTGLSLMPDDPATLVALLRQQQGLSGPVAPPPSAQGRQQPGVVAALRRR